MNDTALIDIAGWLGAIALLSAYALVSTRRLAGNDVSCLSLNVIGGALLTVNAFHYGAFPSVSINVAWIGIALYALAYRRSGSSGTED